MAISTLLSTACSSTSVSQQLQSQTVPQPVIQQQFYGTLVPIKVKSLSLSIKEIKFLEEHLTFMF